MFTNAQNRIASLVGAGNNVFFTNYITFETNRKK